MRAESSAWIGTVTTWKPGGCMYHHETRTQSTASRSEDTIVYPGDITYLKQHPVPHGDLGAPSDVSLSLRSEISLLAAGRTKKLIRMAAMALTAGVR